MTRAFPTRRSSDLRALLVASRNEHQGAVELRHVLEEKRDVHRPRLRHQIVARPGAVVLMPLPDVAVEGRSEEHTSELQSIMRTSYAVFCLKKKKQIQTNSN